MVQYYVLIDHVFKADDPSRITLICAQFYSLSLSS